MSGPTSATIVWRVRGLGNDLNGGGVDTAIVVTDYSQQDAPQLTLTDVVCSGSTNITSAIGGFTSAMVGNAIWLNGSGATAGAYIITTYTNTNSVVIDRAPGTIAAGGGRVGGAWASPQTNIVTQMNAGQTCYWRGRGVAWPQGTADYTGAGYINFVNSPTRAGGSFTIIGEYGTPNIKWDGLMLSAWSAGNLVIENVYFSWSAANYPTFGIISSAGQTGPLILRKCVFDMGSFDTIAAGCNGGAPSGLIVEQCEFFGSGSSGTIHSNFILGVGIFGSVVRNSIFRDSCAPIAIYMNNLGSAYNNTIVNCKAVGIKVDYSSDIYYQSVTKNTIYGCGTGIQLANSSIVGTTVVAENIIANCSTYGLSVISGTVALNKGIAAFVDYNMYYNNTANFNNISAGTHDTVGVNPSFVSTTNNNTAQGGGYDFTPGAVTIGLGVPSQPLATNNNFPGAIAPKGGAGGTRVYATLLG